MSFVKDLKVGEEAEEEFGEFLEKIGWTTGRNTATTIIEKRFYDRWAYKNPPTKASKKKNRPVITFEIKYDKRVKETGNVYFEFETIDNSRADYIVYKIDTDGKFYLQDRATVVNLMYSFQFERKEGKGYEPGIIMPLEVFQKVFKDCEEAFKT